MNSHNLEYLDPSVIKPRSRAWRKYSPAQIKAACRLIENGGGVAIPPLVDRENRVVFGEEFVLAAKELCLKAIPVNRAISMSPEELRLYALNAQKIIDLGEFDDVLLAEELRELEDLLGGEHLKHLVFEEGEITQLLGLDRAVEVGPDQKSDKISPLITKPGDLWEQGDHKHLCASSLEAASFEFLMGKELATCGLTDAPYNLAMNDISSDPTREEFAFAHGEMSPGEFVRFLTTVMRFMKEYSMPGSLHAYFMGHQFLGELFRAGNIAFGRHKAMATWIKAQAGQGSFLRSQTEYVVYFKNGDAPHRNNVQLGKFGRNRTTAWHYDGMTTASSERSDLLKLHATPKPVDMLKDAILDVTVRGDIVIDPFAGIGSTALAAQSAERRAFTIEIEPRFVDAAVRRMRDTYKIDATRSSDGARFSELEEAANKEDQ